MNKEQGVTYDVECLTCDKSCPDWVGKPTREAAQKEVDFFQKYNPDHVFVIVEKP